MANIGFWLDQLSTNPSLRQAALTDGKRFDPFRRGFSTSGLSNAAASHYRILGGGPYTYSITPYPTESFLVIRYVNLVMHETGAWGPNSFMVQAALANGLLFGLFRNNTLVRDFTSEIFGRSMTNNRSIAFAADDYNFKNDQVLDAGCLARWFFDEEHGGPIYLAPGDDLRFTIQAGDTVQLTGALGAIARGFIPKT